MIITLFESLPKDKTQSLGVAEIPLYDPFIKSLKEKSPILSDTKTVRVVYSNLKLLINDAVPEIEVMISLSSPLISEPELETGSFALFKVVDVASLPEEFSLKDGTEKDPNSSKSSMLNRKMNSRLKSHQQTCTLTILIFTYQLKVSLRGKLESIMDF